MSKPSVAAIILAAGKGTRMKSGLHKVLHPIAGRPMLMHLMASVDALSPAKKVVVVGSGKEQLAAALAGTADLAVQEPQLGTGHAVQMAEATLTGFEGDVLILYGDVPFVPTATMEAMIARLNGEDAPAVVVLAFLPDDPTGYGRVIVEGAKGQERIIKMVEQKDASETEKAVKLSNSGLMAVKARDLFALLARVTDNNAQKEFYLTDIVNIANADGRPSVAVTTDPFDVAGINSRAQLAEMERAWQQRRRLAAMEGGATLIAPETVWFAHDTVIGRDVLIEPNVFFGPGVSIADNVTIRANCHIEGARIASGAEVGPFARLRPGTVLGEKTKIGNFVEVKKSVFEAGAKANHLSYIGDAHVGAAANIGAGTITCNYDGYFKYKTEIGAGAFIGSNTSLVAPVKIGDGAIVGAGSVVTKNVEPDALGVTRAEQKSLSGWAAKFRAKMLAKKRGNK
jgi:bifunctional UDP-N-acetylglucosamine pyrophosphorylase / glucosamine-1-phosphate N-acetyltransferase